MAFSGSNIFTLFTANNKTSSTSISGNIAVPLPTYGNMVLVFVAKDNSAGAVTGYTNNEVTSVTDAAGNTYIKLGEYSNTPSTTAGSGTTVAIFAAKVTNALSTNAQVTVNFSSATVAKAVMAYSFSMSSAATIGGPEFAVGGPTPVGLTAPALPTRDRLYLVAGADEGTQGITSVITGFTKFNGVAGTSGGGSASNTSISAAWGIYTADSGGVSPVTATTMSGDFSGLLVSIYEADPLKQLSASATAIAFATASLSVAGAQTVYKGVNWSNYYKGVRSDAQLYRGTKTLHL